LGKTSGNQSVGDDASGGDCVYRIFQSLLLRRKAVRIMQYEPRNQPHLRYVIDGPTSDKRLLATVKYTLKLCEGLGYDFNTVEFAVRDIPYAIDFGNRPDAELTSVGAENFEWVVEESAKWLSQQKNRNQVK
jgi:hypothetical protein